MELYLNSYDLDNYQGKWFNFPNDTIEKVSKWFRNRNIENTVCSISKTKY